MYKILKDILIMFKSILFILILGSIFSFLNSKSQINIATCFNIHTQKSIQNLPCEIHRSLIKCIKAYLEEKKDDQIKKESIDESSNETALKVRGLTYDPCLLETYVDKLISTTKSPEIQNIIKVDNSVNQSSTASLEVKQLINAIIVLLIFLLFSTLVFLLICFFNMRNRKIKCEIPIDKEIQLNKAIVFEESNVTRI